MEITNTEIVHVVKWTYTRKGYRNGCEIRVFKSVDKAREYVDMAVDALMGLNSFRPISSDDNFNLDDRRKSSDYFCISNSNFEFEEILIESHDLVK